MVEDAEPVTRVEVEHARGFAFAASRSGAPLDLAKVGALVAAVDALLGASLVDQARPIVRELRAHVEAAQGPRAAVLDLRAERSKRRET